MPCRNTSTASWRRRRWKSVPRSRSMRPKRPCTPGSRCGTNSTPAPPRNCRRPRSSERASIISSSTSANCRSGSHVLNKNSPPSRPIRSKANCRVSPGASRASTRCWSSCRRPSRSTSNASLEALQEEALGKSAGGAVNAWLGKRGLNNAVRLAQKITVESGWERAVETVLGYALEAVCVDGLDDIDAALSELAQGEVTLFDTRADVAAAARSVDAPTLLEKVQAPWRLDGLLGGVYLAANLDEALNLRARLHARESVITRDGVWLGSGWLRVVRDRDGQSGVLVREQALHVLQAQIEQARQRVAELQAQV